MASGLCGRNVAVHAERGMWVEKQILGRRASDVLGLLYQKGLQGHLGFSVEESVMVCPDVTSTEVPAPGRSFPSCDSATPFL